MSKADPVDLDSAPGGSVRRGLAWVGVGSLVVALLGLAKMAIAARVLPPEAIGEYALLLVYTQAGGAFANLGMSAALIHFERLTDRQLNAVLGYSALSAGLVAVITFALAASALEAVWLPWLALLTLVVALRTFGDHYQTLRVKAHEHRFNASTQMLTSLVGESLSVVGLLLGFGLPALVLGLVLGIVVQALVQVITGRRRFPRVEGTWATWTDMLPLLKFGGWQLGQHLTNLLTTRLDRVLIAWGFGLTTLSAYELAIQVCAKPYQLLGSLLQTVYTPLYADQQTDHAAINRVYLAKLNFVIWLQTPIYLLIIWQAEYLTQLLFGPDWPLTALTMQALGVYLFARALSNPIGSYLIGLGRPDRAMWQTAILALVVTATLAIGVFLLDYEQLIWVYALIATGCMLLLDAHNRWTLTRMSSASIYRTVLKALGIGLVALLVANGLSLLLGLTAFAEFFTQSCTVLLVYTSLAFGLDMQVSSQLQHVLRIVSAKLRA